MDDVKRNGKQKKDDVKDTRLEFRITAEERRQLEEMRTAQGKSISDILRNGIRMQYNMHKYLP